MKDKGSLVKVALAFASVMHGAQKYGALPYMTHVMGVVALAEKFGLSDEQQVIAALHDILEDTSASRREMELAFGKDVTNCVFVLTRKLGENYDDYVARVAQNPSARLVKLCDLLYNMSNTPPASLQERYQKAIFYLATHVA